MKKIKLFRILQFTSPRSFAIEFAHGFQRGDVTGLAAQLAYYSLLSLFPFLIFGITLCGYFISPDKVLHLLEHYVPNEAMSIVEKNVLEVVQGKKGGLLSFGIIATIWSASNGISATIKALNEAYGVKECRSFLVSRLLSIFLTFGLIFAIAVALVLPVFGKMIGDFAFSYLGLDMAFLKLWVLIRWLISFFILAFIFSILYYLAPCKKLKFSEVWYGSVIASALWQLVSLGFAFYVEHFGNYSATYGSLGAIIILMLWFYFTGVVLLSGGVLNAALHKLKIGYAKNRGLLKEAEGGS